MMKINFFNKSITATAICFLASFMLYADNTVNSSATPAQYQISFFQIIANSGMPGIISWIAIFILISGGFILGISAIISSAITKKAQIPLPVKLLGIGIGTLLLLGLFCTTTGALGMFAALANANSDARAEIMGLTLSQILYALSFSILGCFEYIFFLTISVIILHFRQKNSCHTSRKTTEFLQ
jgi:hypothetical protein